MGQHCITCNFPCDDDVLFCPECVEADKFNERKAVNDEVRELHRLWEQDCKRMNKEIDRLNNELEEKKQNETESEKETALTEISKFEWKEKTCEDIIEDMRNMKKMLI